ncbi:uncharacterized protein ACA1_290810 [Acanthamoeba castellanii str. Neff]|uniref:SprT-like domain-containing protein n=1 Tax=Acanthamoeba castellanii (strain ATCC 30010 / Neff) TaxID=1257118 RepID=L8HI88_ACACF|nr:uncharacterized protein ACA1_290810 [Acanthamoeba castellanii str. Neff]ELR25304.1 hypothetical protein ACA1_290810 [Acanthamoeba castellanii str. Neff]
MQQGAGGRVQEVPEEEEGDWVVDLQELFRRFDRRFFHSRLAARGGVFVNLSEPILQYRSKSDIIDALLHEMIHAYLYVTRDKDWTGHGPSFLNLSQAINKSEGTNVQPYHHFREEVEFLKDTSNHRSMPRTSSPKVPAAPPGGRTLHQYFAVARQKLDDKTASDDKQTNSAAQGGPKADESKRKEKKKEEN